MTLSPHDAAVNYALMPNLFIVGAMKAGTTSLAMTLAEHPAIHLAKIKEPEFLGQLPGFAPSLSDLGFPGGGFRARSSIAKAAAIRDWKNYLRLFEGGENCTYRLDASTAYFITHSVSDAIQCYSPQAKVIISLRSPYERALSAYRFTRTRGTEPAESFAEAIDDELRSNRENVFPSFRYLSTSKYSIHITHWLKTFGERLFVLDMAQLGSVEFLNNDIIKGFLNLNEKPDIEFRRDNVTKEHSGLTNAFKQARFNPTIRGAAQKIVPMQIRSLLAKPVDSLLERTGKIPRGLSEQEIQAFVRMSSIVEADITALERILERDFSHWRLDSILHKA